MKLARLLHTLSEHGLLVETQAMEGLSIISGGLVTDSRDIQEGDIFVCIKGLSVDGHKYIPIARQKKTAIIVCEDVFSDQLPSIRVTNSRKAAAIIAKLQFNDPSSRFTLVGVTGTNGKTSTSLILYHTMRFLGYKVGWIGTLGYYINDSQYTTGHTTPDILELNKILDTMANEGVSHVFMEVSSHAVALDRIFGLEFDICLFTNLSREHLDFHHDMESYGEAKYQFFSSVLAKKSVGLVNIDDHFGKVIHTRLRDQDAYVFSVGNAPGEYQIHNQSMNWQGSDFSLSSPEGDLQLHSQLVGRFNVCNLAMAAATLSLLGMEKRQIEESIARVEPVPGRMQSITNTKGIGLFVDYAHTPDALENVLKTARELPHKRVLCLIGAGGDRDKGKRPLMLTSALRNSEAVIISDDNPRSENPNGIVLDMISDAHPDHPWWIIRDRKLAIHTIVRMAREGDVVLICGKGHEQYQEIEGIKYPFDDVSIASNAVETEPGISDELALPIDDLMLKVILGSATERFPVGYQKPVTYRYVSTDSRSIRDGSIFFALRGERFDGHAYLGNVLASQSNHAIGEIALPEHDHYTRVESVKESYRRICKRYLMMFGVYKVAITGSTGKTSTKELLDLVCRQIAPTLKTDANENNIIGLCKTILRVNPRDEYAVFEIGTNHFGEISELADTCIPDAGVIVNIGPSHLEAFGDESGVYKEKVALFKRPLDIRLFDGDDARFNEFKDSGTGVGYTESADYQISGVQIKEHSTSFMLSGHTFEIPYTVRHMVTNAAFAIAFGLSRDIPVSEIQSALTGPLKLGFRMMEVESRYGKLILDCYNANPISMQNAIEHWLNLEADKPHVAILGDMLELGDMAASYHNMIGAILAEKTYSTLITVGEYSRFYRPQESDVTGMHYPTVESAICDLDNIYLPSDAVILVKASHGIHLEKIAERLQRG